MEKTVCELFAGVGGFRVRVRKIRFRLEYCMGKPMGTWKEISICV